MRVTIQILNGLLSWDTVPDSRGYSLASWGNIPNFLGNSLASWSNIPNFWGNSLVSWELQSAFLTVWSHGIPFPILEVIVWPHECYSPNSWFRECYSPNILKATVWPHGVKFRIIVYWCYSLASEVTFRILELIVWRKKVSFWFLYAAVCHHEVTFRILSTTVCRFEVTILFPKVTIYSNNTVIIQQ